jgi:hypothetical protein
VRFEVFALTHNHMDPTPLADAILEVFERWSSADRAQHADNRAALVARLGEAADEFAALHAWFIALGAMEGSPDWRQWVKRVIDNEWKIRRALTPTTETGKR